MEKAILQLVEHFNEIVVLDEADKAFIIPKLEVKQVHKKEYLLRSGETSKHMRYIAQGSMRAFYVDEKSQEHTLQLGIENWWINDLYSYFSEKPSRMFIQAVEPTTLVQIGKKNLEILYKEVPKISDFFRQKTQNAYVALQERTIENASVDAYSRYIEFVSRYRNLEQRFPQYMIASYLGITPEFLSFLRKKHTHDLS